MPISILAPLRQVVTMDQSVTYDPVQPSTPVPITPQHRDAPIQQRSSQRPIATEPTPIRKALDFNLPVTGEPWDLDPDSDLAMIIPDWTSITLYSETNQSIELNQTDQSDQYDRNADQHDQNADLHNRNADPSDLIADQPEIRHSKCRNIPKQHFEAVEGYDIYSFVNIAIGE